MASLGSTPGLIIAAGVGAAASTALEPAFEAPRQDAWRRNPNRILGIDTIARLVAQGGVILGETNGSTPGSAYEDALRQGFTNDKLDRLIYLAQRVPDFGQVRDLANRKIIAPGDVDYALTREAFAPAWQAHMKHLFDAILSPGELAAAIHRGLVPAEGLLLGEQPQPPFNVQAYPQYPINPLTEARSSGLDRDRLGVLVGLQGLPMGVIEAAQAYFRGILTHGDYIRAFNESNNRNEWAEAVLGYARQIPTARDFFENALRGYHTLTWAQQQAERHGMSHADSLVIYQNQGRPMAVSNITKALARGGKFQPEPGELTDPYMASIVEGNLKPGYYNLAEALKYTLPSAFVMRTLATTGVWTEAKTALRLREIGWPPEDADEAAHAWASSVGGAKEDPWVKKAEQQLWTAIHKGYVKDGSLDQTTADSYLTNLIADATARATVLDLWTTEKNVGKPAGPPA